MKAKTIAAHFVPALAPILLGALLSGALEVLLTPLSASAQSMSRYPSHSYQPRPSIPGPAGAPTGAPTQTMGPINTLGSVPSVGSYSGNTHYQTAPNLVSYPRRNPGTDTQSAPVMQPAPTSAPTPSTVTPPQSASSDVSRRGITSLSPTSPQQVGSDTAQSAPTQNATAAPTTASAVPTAASPSASQSASPVQDLSSVAASTQTPTANTTPTNTPWTNDAITAQTGTFTASFDAVPLVNKEDALVALSPKQAGAYTDLAAIVRFNNTGTIDARKGGAYAAQTSVPYTANATYRFRMVVNVPQRTYSVYVTPQNQGEVTLAKDYPFRTEQSSATSLNYRVRFASMGGATVNNFSITGIAPAPTPAPSTTPGSSSTPVPTPSASTTSSNTPWTNDAIAAQTGTFTASFDAVPLVNKEDALVALSPKQAGAYTDLAAIVRFNNTGAIDVRNAGAYAAQTSVPYTAGTSYHFRMVVNIPQRTYSVYVTPPGKSETALAPNYTFRTEQSNATSLNYRVRYASSGGANVTNFTITSASQTTTATSTGSASSGGASGGSTSTSTTGSSSYDSTILAGKPVLYLTMGSPSSGSESDKSGHGLNGTYKGGSPNSTKLPNGDTAAVFNGSSQYLTVPSNSSLSIATTKKLTWEAWVRPDVSNYPHQSSDGYVDWMGKCQSYSPTCEWEARAYSTQTAEGRPNRLSAYAFNPSAGLGSAADWQPQSGLLKPGQWLHVVGEYQTETTPSQCDSSYPGTINIWVNGVQQSFASHAPTGCMSQYKIAPKANTSPLNIGTMAMDTWFQGAVGKVAIYDRLLSQTEISAHFKAMTGASPSGSCGSTCSIAQPTPSLQ